MRLPFSSQYLFLSGKNSLQLEMLCWMCSVVSFCCGSSLSLKPLNRIDICAAHWLAVTTT